MPAHRLCLPLLLAALACAGAGCGPSEPAVLEIHGSTMGTAYSVKIAEPPAQIDRARLAADIEVRLAAINARMSTYDPDSELSRFNANASTEWVDISEQTRDVVAEALRVSRLTDGAFDVTVGPAVNLWGFGPGAGPQRIPGTEEIDGIRRRIGYALLMLRVEPPALRKARADLYVDLSAIAKGYAVDQLAALLEAKGIANFLVEIGGELQARGNSARGDPWRVAVERPLVGQRSVQRVLTVRDAGLATSGNYRNFFEQDGQRFAHTIDPRTARPVVNALASATVVHPSTMTADALATAMTVLGAQAGKALAERHGIAALFIERRGDDLVESVSSAFRARVPGS